MIRVFQDRMATNVMKVNNIIYVTCFLVVGCGSPVREEIVERHLNGEKLLVVTYEGTGSDEKAIRRDYYFDNGNLRQSDHDSTFVQF